MAGLHVNSLRRRQSYKLATLLLFLHCLTTSITGQSTSNSSSTLTRNSTITANRTLVSPGGVFELGFTSGVQSGLKVYTLAIWYVETQTPRQVVWVADRSMALKNTTAASLSLSAAGNFEVHGMSGNGSSPTLLWAASNTTNLQVANATMEDTGNLVLRNASNTVVWQSFDTPTDTLLPTQIFLANKSSSVLTAWENDGDWRNGNYSLQWVNPNNLTASWQSPYGLWKSAPGPNITTMPYYWPTAGSTTPFSYVVLTPNGDFRAVDDQVTPNLSTTVRAATSGGLQGRLFRLTLDKDGNLRMYSWSKGNSTWNMEWKALTDECTIVGYCGPYAICNTGGQCSCPDGFHLVNPNDTRLGCQRNNPAEYCNQTQNEYPDTFLPAVNADWASNDLNYTANVNLSTCKQQCLDACACQGIVIDPPNPVTLISDFCYLKKDALLNGAPQSGKLGYFRVGGQAPAVVPRPPRKGVNKLAVVASTLGTLVAVMTALSCVFGTLLVARRVERGRQERLEEKWAAAKGAMIRFTYPEIVLMTANFGTKIGEGGFGTVFKGHVGGGVTVAVKRLNKQLSNQVEREFLNEVDSIGLIHHVHLVTLLGYCAEDNHRLLVYEYVKRGSLDRVLFRKDPSSFVLEWRPRFAIAIQTARGLAYLHDDCNECIIHCDVKPENILLDCNFFAKVADFGLSRIMKRGQAQTETMNIRGTRGYLGPEWTLDHLRITNKVDVFSYGMVLLEIISGRRNLMSNRDNEPDMYFPTWAFPKIETSDAFLQVVDPALTGIVNREEVKRALQVAFWCINKSPQMRPTMREVVQMLQGHVAIPLPIPKPDFFENLEFDSVRRDGDSDNSALHWSTSGASAMPIEEVHGSILLLSTPSEQNSLQSYRSSSRNVPGVATSL